jgi:ribosomal protein S16
MLKIKLFPKGKKHQRTFRIVVSEARSKSNGNFVADLGFYTPQTKTIQIDQEKLAQWQKNGAQITLGVDHILNPDKYPKKVKVKPEKIIKPKAEPKPEVLVETKTNTDVSEVKPENIPESQIETDETKAEETPTQPETSN